MAINNPHLMLLESQNMPQDEQLALHAPNSVVGSMTVQARAHIPSTTDIGEAFQTPSPLVAKGQSAKRLIENDQSSNRGPDPFYK